jgi:hypothetical protein
MLNLTFGFLNVWVIYLGAYIRWKYPRAIKKDAFWIQNCPIVVATTTVTGAAETVNSGEIF